MEGYWGKNALKAYEYGKFNSALGFASALSHGVWRPSWVEGNYRRAKIADEPNQVTKVQLAGASFLRTALQKKMSNTPTERTIIDAVINNKPVTKSWAASMPGGWYKRATRLILNANGNLDINDASQFAKLFGYD